MPLRWWWWFPLENNHPELHPGQSDDRTRRSHHRVADSYPKVTPRRSTKEDVPGLPKCHSQSGRSAERKLFHKGKDSHMAGHIPLSLQCAEQEKRRTVEDHRAQETCKEHRQKNPVKSSFGHEQMTSLGMRVIAPSLPCPISVCSFLCV